MPKPLVSRKKAQSLSSALVLIGLAIISYLDAWWPGIMIVIGIPLALRQFLLGKYQDMFLSLGVFVGFFLMAQFDISWRVLVPVLLTMAALYILCKEWVEGSTLSEAEKEEDRNIEIEEETKHPR